MKTSNFVASTGSASSLAILWERSCFHQICERSIMWERFSSGATRSGRREIRYPSPAENLPHNSGTLATARPQPRACAGSMAVLLRLAPMQAHVKPVGLVSYAPHPSRKFNYEMEAHA